MTGKLAGRVAIVTGSGANIGEACARALAAEGAIVVLADINIGGAEAVAADLRAGGHDAFAHALDLADDASIAALFAAVVERYGRIDILHNNAAETRAAHLEKDVMLADMDPEIWDRSFTVNARGTMLMIRQVLPVMIAAGGGVIINTSTGATLMGDILNPAYAASKSAVNSLTRYVATQYGKHNIRCNAVLPGMIVTPHARTIMYDEQFAMMEAHTLLPRLGEPRDIAGAVVFLATDDSGFITGQLLSVDGGISMHQPHVADTRKTLAANA